MVFSSKFNSNTDYDTYSHYPRRSYSTEVQQQKEFPSVALANSPCQHQSAIYGSGNIYETNKNSCSNIYYNNIRSQVRSRFCECDDFTHPVHATLPTRSIKLLSSQAYPDLGTGALGYNTATVPRKPPRDNSNIDTRGPKNDSSIANLSSSIEDVLNYPTYTVDQLVKKLVPTDLFKPQISLLHTMILCSRIHVRPDILLDKLVYSTFRSLPSLSTNKRIRTSHNLLDVLSYWTETFPYDFRQRNMMEQLEETFRLINKYQTETRIRTNQIHQSLLIKLDLVSQYEQYIRQVNARASQSNRRFFFATDIINECSTPTLFAQQITHIELDRLKPIGAEELLQYLIAKSASEEARARSNQAQSSSNLQLNQNGIEENHLLELTPKKSTICLETYIQWSNRLTDFVTTEIVKHTQRSLRVRMINYFIEAAEECFRLHNFNSLIAILGGLNTPPVRRLKKTWSKVRIETMKNLEQYTDVSKNFANYRSALKEALNDARDHNWSGNKAVIPFASIILKDIYYIKTHSNDYTSQGGINLKKYQSISDCIAEVFSQCKQSKVSFERNDVIINYIVTSSVFNEDSLMLASFECEPASTTQEKERLKKLQEIQRVKL